MQVVLTSTEVLLQAGSSQPAAATAALSSPAAVMATTPAQAELGDFATFRVGEATGSLRCSQLQRGWREPHALVVRTAANVASAGFTTRVDTLRGGTAAAVRLMARLQQAKLAAAAQQPSLVEGASTASRLQGGASNSRQGAPAPSADPAAMPNLQLPAPSPATAAAYPLDTSPVPAAGEGKAWAAHTMTRLRPPKGLEDSGRILLQARVHVAETTAEVLAGPAADAPLLRASVAAVGFSGAPPGLPEGTRSSSAAATPQVSETMAEDREPPYQPSKTPTSASVWLQRTNVIHHGGLIADVPWQLSVASITVEVDAEDRADGPKAASDSLQGEPDMTGFSGIPALVERQVSTLRQLLKVGQVTADLMAAAQRQPSPSQPSASLLLNGETYNDPAQ